MPHFAMCMCRRLMRSARRSVCPKGRVIVKNLIAPLSFAIFVFFCQAGAMRAQVAGPVLTSEAPVLPMDIKFRHVPQYFEQSFTNDPHYTRIEALVDEEGVDIILLDKTTNREALYSNVKRRADALAADGVNAYSVSIEFAPDSTDDSHPAFLFHFHDRFGQNITWRFLTGEMTPHASPEAIFYTHSGVTLLYAPRRAPAITGTRLTIASREYPLESSQSHDSLVAFYATDMTISAILPGTDLWNVESSPDDSVQPAKWTLASSGGQRRIVVLRQLSDAEAAIDQIDPNNPDVPQFVINIVRRNGSYGVSSVLLETHDDRLWIFFGPALPLPARSIDLTTVTFTIAENEEANVATGELEVQRTVGAEHVLWRFDTPNAVKGATIITGVNLIPGAHAQAKCVSVACSDRR